jgi:hypothetical protein
MQPLVTDMDKLRLRSLLATPLAFRDAIAARSLEHKLESARRARVRDSENRRDDELARLLLVPGEILCVAYQPEAAGSFHL